MQALKLLFFDVWKQNLLPAFYLSCIEIMHIWEKMVSAEGQCELDVWPYLQTLTGDAISRTVFGSDYEKGRKIFQLRKELAQVYIQAAQSVYLPGMRLFLPVTVLFVSPLIFVCY